MWKASTEPVPSSTSQSGSHSSEFQCPCIVGGFVGRKTASKPFARTRSTSATESSIDWSGSVAHGTSRGDSAMSSSATQSLRTSAAAFARSAVVDLAVPESERGKDDLAPDALLVEVCHPLAVVVAALGAHGFHHLGVGAARCAPLDDLAVDVGDDLAVDELGARHALGVGRRHVLLVQVRGLDAVRVAGVGPDHVVHGAPGAPLRKSRVLGRGTPCENPVFTAYAGAGGGATTGRGLELEPARP